MFNYIRSCLFLLMAVSVRPACAGIKLPAVIGSNMVLQQQFTPKLWGKAGPGSTVTIRTSWDNQVYRVPAAADSSWSVRVATPKAGGPYSISLEDGKEKISLNDVLIGEVWLCSGQSNMEMPVSGFSNQPVSHSLDILLNAADPAIRLFMVDKISTGTPRKDCAGAWNAASAETVNKFSAVGYLFGKMLRKQLNVPVGIIQTAWGGTVIEAWMSKSSLAPFPEVKILPAAEMKATDKNNPTGLFNGMVEPVIGFGIKGVIWYQGEQNRMDPALYARLMPAMVKEWRDKWGIGSWPFYYAQIAPYTYPQDKEKAIRSAQLREVQRLAAQTIPQSGMAVTMDLGTETIIHPPDKETVATRLALWALSKDYHQAGIPCESPEYNSMKVKGNKVTVAFLHAGNGLTSYLKPLKNFEVAGADRVFYPAEAKIVRGGVELSSDKVAVPVAVRYAFKAWVVGDLYNTEGLPASSFRTDDWELE